MIEMVFRATESELIRLSMRAIPLVEELPVKRNEKSASILRSEGNH